MRAVAFVFALVVSASATEPIVVDGEVAACAPVKDQALQAVSEQLGLAGNAAVEKSRAHCKAMAKADCDTAKECKYCDGDTTCWPQVDLSNPCDQGTINNILLAGEVTGDVGSAIGEATSTVLAKCGEKTSKEDCPTFGCEWCGTSSTCHVFGSAHNECLKERLKQMAQEQSQAAVDAAKAQASEEVKKVMEQCTTLNGNETGCGANDICIWCGSTHNICYFMGDKSNKCIRERVQKHIDAATGVAKPIAEWAGSSYTDLSAWSKGLCGGKDESTCNNDVHCHYCSDSSSCHTHGSVRDPCGTYQKGKTAVKDKWNEVFGSDPNCEADKVETHKTLKEGADAAKANLQFACTEYMKTKFFAQQSLSSLGEDVQGVSDSAQKQVQESMSEMASVNIDQAKTALKDAIASSNESMSSADSLAAFEELNPCVDSDISAAGPRIASLATLVVPAFMVVIFG